MHSLMNDSMSGISTTELVPQIFDDFLTGVTIVNKKSEIVYYNKAQGHIDNMNPDDVLGKSINDVHKVGEGVAHPTMLAIISRRPLVNHSFCYTTLSGKLVNSVQNIFAIVKDGESLGCATFMSEYGSILEAYNLGKDDDPSKASPDAAFRESPRLGEDSFNQLVTNDKDMFESLEIVAKALDTPSPILIRGEKGVEKDILAKMIHNGSSRRDGPFFVLNCASGQENILEGILFGTVEGAFSSAVDRPGMLELADGGTLFLDEIDAMPPALQTTLARPLSEGKVRRVGSSNSDTGFSVKIVS
ncbi:MAG: sigma 54-interacting transcriptional regulator, partial [Deltaproteobacteria bacterium]|nr:sigma 54-interacting transcriptional regulator [Deltaproteobacteria bacterium]